MDKLYGAIDELLASGVPLNGVEQELVERGWPPQMVELAVNTWRESHGRQRITTDFKTWLQKYYRLARPAVALVVVLNLFDTAIALLKPWPVKIMADSVFGNVPAWGPLEPYTGTVTLLAITSAMTISLYIFGTIFGVFRDYYLLKIGFWLNRTIKNDTLRHILHLPLFHDERLSKGDYVYRQNVITDSLSELVLGTRSAIIQSVLIITGVLVIMFLINPALTLISVVLLPLLFGTIKIVGPKMGVYARQYVENASETSSAINESIDNAEAIQAFTLEEKSIKRIDGLWEKGYFFTKKNMLWGELLDGTNGLFVTLATSAVMLLGGAWALDQKLTLGDLLIFMSYMSYLIGPVETLIDQVTTRFQKLIDVSRIYEVMSDHPDIEFLRKDLPMPTKLNGDITFQNVSYAYKDSVIFQNLNLHIPAGQKVGIIGPSGSGKSTILKLLPLFNEPTGGRILIDNIDIQSVSLQQLRQRIAWVSQSPQLFNETVLENILEGNIYRPISQEELINAIEVSNISEFVLKMPLGLQSPIGENGSTLSGGQRQRLSITRALIKDAPIICLDEPTAALDIKSENYIRDSLSKMVEGKTVVMVTHRKPLLDLMDVIYVLQDGNLVNVEELGGLNRYLAELEGIEYKSAEEQIAAEAQSADLRRLEVADTIANFQPAALLQPEPVPVHTTVLDSKDVVTQDNNDQAVTISIHHGDKQD